MNGEHHPVYCIDIPYKKKILQGSFSDFLTYRKKETKVSVKKLTVLSLCLFCCFHLIHLERYF